MNNEQLAPPDLHSAALMIQNYGKENGLTPSQLLEIFHEGIGTGITLRFNAGKVQSTNVKKSVMDDRGLIIPLPPGQKVGVRSQAERDAAKTIEDQAAEIESLKVENASLKRSIDSAIEMSAKLVQDLEEQGKLLQRLTDLRKA
jgi:hypothetical protein